MERISISKAQRYDHSITVNNNTWFERCHTLPKKCLIWTYCFSAGMSFENVVRESIWFNKEKTVADRYSFCHEICELSVDKQYDDESYTLSITI